MPEPTPYTEFSTFDTSGRPYEVAFEVEYPSDWTTRASVLQEAKGGWSYRFYRLDPEVYPSTPDCEADGQVKFTISIGRASNEPDATLAGVDEERDVGGVETQVAFHEGADRIPAEFNPAGCVVLWARAVLVRSDKIYGFSLVSMLPSHEREKELFRRMLDSFMFL